MLDIDRVDSAVDAPFAGGLPVWELHYASLMNTSAHGTHFSGLVKSVYKSGQMLRLFTTRSGNWGVTELSEKLGFSKTVTYNLAETLVRTGLLEFDRGTRTYKVGLLAFQLGLAFGSTYSFRDAATRIIDGLATRTGTTVVLAVPDGVTGEFLCIASASASGLPQFRLIAVEGQRMSAYRSAVGRAYLSQLDEELLDALLVDMPESEGDAESLTGMLREFREQGWASQIGEIIPGIDSFAVPLIVDGVCIAAMSLSWISTGQDEELGDFLQQLQATASELAAICGRDIAELSHPLIEPITG